jgi:hypothetical protein
MILSQFPIHPIIVILLLFSNFILSHHKIFELVELLSVLTLITPSFFTTTGIVDIRNLFSFATSIVFSPAKSIEYNVSELLLIHV